MANDETRIKIGTKEEPVRFSYANVFAPREGMNGGKAKYSVTLLISKKYKKQIKAIEAAIEVAKQAGIASKWGGKLPKFKNETLRDGDEEYPDKPEYEGMMFISAKSDRKPQIVDANLQEIMDEDEFYSGCYGRASVNFFAYNNESKGIAAGLGNLQKTADGEPFGGGGRSAASDFGEDEDGMD